jgi:hypothetical protein
MTFASRTLRVVSADECTPGKRRREEDDRRLQAAAFGKAPWFPLD